MRRKKLESEWYGDEVEMETAPEEKITVSDELLAEYMKENGDDEAPVKNVQASAEEEITISPELEKEYLKEDAGEDEETEPKEIKYEFIGLIGLVLGAGAVFSCLVMRVAHFPFVGILSLLGVVVNTFSIITNRARVLALFGIILSAAGLGMVAMVVLKLLRLM